MSQQIEQAKLFEDGCESENDNSRAAVAGTCVSDMSKLVTFNMLTFLDIL